MDFTFFERTRNYRWKITPLNITAILLILLEPILQTKY